MDSIILKRRGFQEKSCERLRSLIWAARSLWAACSRFVESQLCCLKQLGFGDFKFFSPSLLFERGIWRCFKGITNQWVSGLSLIFVRITFPQTMLTSKIMLSTFLRLTLAASIYLSFFRKTYNSHSVDLLSILLQKQDFINVDAGHRFLRLP